MVEEDSADSEGGGEGVGVAPPPCVPPNWLRKLGGRENDGCLGWREKVRGSGK
jgi:hypothetical protein